MLVASVAVITASLQCVREHHAPWLTQHRTGMTAIYMPVSRDDLRDHILLIAFVKRDFKHWSKSHDHARAATVFPEPGGQASAVSRPLAGANFVHRHRQSADTPPASAAPSMYQRARVAGICSLILRAHRVVCAVQASSAIPLLRGPHRQPASTQRRHGRVAVSASLQSITASPLYSTWLQSAVAVVILGAVDAAYSGDWCSSHLLKRH